MVGLVDPVQRHVRGGVVVVGDAVRGDRQRAGVEEVGAEDARLDDHRLDPERCHLHGERFTDAGDRELRRAVQADAGLALETRPGTDVHQPPGPLLAHDGQHGTGDIDQAEDVEVEQRPGLRVGDLLQRAEQAAAGVVDQDVDAPEPVHGGLDRLRDAVVVRHVQGDREDVVGAPQIGRHAFRVSYGDRDIVTACQRGAGDFSADSTGGAGDKPRSHGKYLFRRFPFSGISC